MLFIVIYVVIIVYYHDINVIHFFSATNIKTHVTIPKQKCLHLFHKTRSDKTQKDIKVFDRLTLNKMLMDKPPVLADESYKWLS